MNWINVPSGVLQGFTDVDFIDSNYGTVVGSNGTILRTTDGGNSWFQQSSATSYSLTDVCFVDINIGTVVLGLLA